VPGDVQNVVTARRSALARALFPLLLLAVSAACGGDGAGQTVGSSTTSGGGEAVDQPGVVECGGRFDDLPGPRAPLTVSGSFPARVDGAAGDGTFTGTVIVTATQPVKGVTSPAADVYVARSGEVVATPLPKDLVGLALDLGPGASRELAATGSVRRCPQAEAPLPPGRFEVYAVVTVDGAVAVGGPWPVDVV
jgi:hypothetical protein